MKKLGMAVGMAVLFSTSSALAATDGSLGLTSSGTVNLSVTLGNVVQLSSLADFTVPLWNIGDGDIDLTQSVCVFANNAGGDYQVSTTSANAAGAQWRLFDGGTNYVNYSIGWVDAPGGTFLGRTDGGFGSGGISVNQDNGDTSSPTCALGPTATLALNVVEVGNLDAAADGVYTDVLTILVTPN